MPISPENKKLYPSNWRAISFEIRHFRARGFCEHFIDGIRCNAENGRAHPITGSIVVLTVAHLDHNPSNCSDDNLEAMCQRCHLRYDQHHHTACDKTVDMFKKEVK